MSGMVHCQLWMGSLEPYMTESFILSAFRKLGENPLSVKIMRNKFTGEPAGYCFVHFATDEEAIDTMHKLNGKPISGTSPVVRFRLNNASNTGRNILDREYSVWVGDLSSDVDDYNLYRVFSSKYNTIKTAKVILDNSGCSKGYGFVKFGGEEEMTHALMHMNGFVGLGNKALKICNAVPKPKGSTTGTDSTTSSTTFPTTNAEYGPYYDTSTYWQNYASWTGYYDQNESTTASEAYNSSDPSSQIQHVNTTEEADLELVEHTVPLDVDRLNQEIMERDINFWDALENAKWIPYDDQEIFHNNFSMAQHLSNFTK